ncbi:hypothetical protein CHS0354_038529 [Potamilus streckersoni]|uniref:Uncharacterized protein n=1 Tax=Potamilus streckersoni TaxID=2493646 RepID=A0AAE0VQZ0_9BIVA|nr:hypothetical protein CHS0354_038529 [Potamilus streckersoni]
MLQNLQREKTDFQNEESAEDTNSIDVKNIRARTKNLTRNKQQPRNEMGQASPSGIANQPYRTCKIITPFKIIR